MKRLGGPAATLEAGAHAIDAVEVGVEREAGLRQVHVLLKAGPKR